MSQLAKYLPPLPKKRVEVNIAKSYNEFTNNLFNELKKAHGYPKTKKQ